MSACLARRPYGDDQITIPAVCLLLASQAWSNDECRAYGRNKGCKEKLATVTCEGAASGRRAQVCGQVGWKWHAVPAAS